MTEVTTSTGGKTEKQCKPAVDNGTATDNTAFFQMLTRMVKAGSKRAGNSDEYDLRHFAAIGRGFEFQLRQAVLMQIAGGKSWADIGQALGISRQAAFKRFKEVKEWVRVS